MRKNGFIVLKKLLLLLFRLFLKRFYSIGNLSKKDSNLQSVKKFVLVNKKDNEQFNSMDIASKIKKYIFK